MAESYSVEAVLSAVDKNYSKVMQKASEQIDKVGSGLESTGKKFESVGSGMQNIGKKMMVGLTLPLAALGTAAIKTGMGFEESMSKVAAISGATGSELQRLEDTAREMGATTRYSASESADALGYMALAGWKTQEMVDALPDVLNLATAGSLDLATASDIVTDMMSMFGMKADEASRASNVFARAQADSNLNVEQLSEALIQAGPAAAAAGAELEQTSAILGIFANQGLKGSKAGTTLNAMYNDITKNAEDGAIAIGKSSVAVYDSNGSMREMGAIMADVEKATNGMSDEQRNAALSGIFQQQSIKGVNMLLAAGMDELTDLELALYDSSGAAQEMADVMDDNMQGSLLGLQSATEELGIAFFKMSEGPIRSIIDGLTNLVRWFGNLDESTQQTIYLVGAMIAAIGPIVFVLGKVAAIIGVVMKSVGAFTLAIKSGLGVMGAFKAGMLAIMGPAGWVTAAIVALIGVGVALWRNWDVIKEKASALGEWISNAWENIKEKTSEVWGAISDYLMEIWEPFGEYFAELWESIQEIFLVAWEPIKELWADVSEFFQELWGDVSEFFIELWATTLEYWQEQWEQMKETLLVLWESIVTAITPIIELIVDLITIAWDLIKEVSVLVWNAIKDQLVTIWEFLKAMAVPTFNLIVTIIKSAWEVIKVVTTTVWNLIKGVLTAVWGLLTLDGKMFADGITSVISAAWNGIKSVTSTVWNAIKTVLSSVWEYIKSLVSTGANAVKNTITTIFNALKGIVASAFNGVRSAVSTGMSGALKVVTGVAKGFFNAGKNIVSNIANGIKNGAKFVTDAIGGVLSKARNLLPFSPPKDRSSPLVDIHKNGIGEQIAKGIYAGESEVDKAMKSILDTDLDTNAHVNSTVQHEIKSARQQPAYINVNIGGQNFRGFVENISDEQGRITDLELQF